MNYYIFFIYLFSSIFLILLFYFLYKTSGNITKFKVTKEEIIKNKNININNILNQYNNNKECSKICKQEICDDYQVQKIKYDLCKDCSKKLMCYDPLEGICKFCLNFNSCENLYGCNNNEPLEPSKNYCQKCW